MVFTKEEAHRCTLMQISEALVFSDVKRWSDFHDLVSAGHCFLAFSSWRVDIRVKWPMVGRNHYQRCTLVGSLLFVLGD